jgi:integrase
MPATFKNDAQLRALKPTDDTYTASDEGCRGLVARVYPNGRKVFRWNGRRIGGKLKPLILGDYGDPDAGGLTLALARVKIEHAKQSNDAGLDVEGGDLLEKPKTIADLAELFYKTRILGRRDHPEKVRQVIDADIRPRIGHLPVSDSLKTIHLRAPVLAAVERGSTAHAKTILAVVKQMFGFAASHGFLATDISGPLKADDLGARDGARDRLLTPEEIRWLWHAIDDSPTEVTRPVRLWLRLLLLMPARTGELRRARWSDVNLDAGTWTIPVEHQKSRKKAVNLKPFVVPLTEDALGVFNELHGLTSKDKHGKPIALVLPSPTDSSVPMDRQAAYKAFVNIRKRENRERLKAKLEPIAEDFTVHDFRRTARTAMTDKLGVQPHVAELALTHSLGRIFATYDLGGYMEERKAALQAWHDYLGRIVSDEPNVIQFSNTGARGG